MNFTISNKAYAKSVLNTIYKQIEEGKSYNIVFEKIRSTKTKKQLGFIFGGVIKSLVMYFNNLGCEFTADQIKEWLYSEIGVVDMLFLPNGQQKTILKTLSGMSKKEASDFIFKLIMFIDTSEALEGFVLPPDLRYCWTRELTGGLVEEVEQYDFPLKNEFYLKHLRKLTCIRCGKKGGEAHHIKRGSGLGKKNPDWFAIPLCNECHTRLHSVSGEPSILDDISGVISGLDIEFFCKVAYYLWRFNYR